MEKIPLVRGTPSEKYIDTIYREYRKYIFTVVSNSIFNKNIQVIEDIVQEVFLIAQQKYDLIKDYKEIKAWLSKTAVNLTYNQNKKYIKANKFLESNPDILEMQSINGIEERTIENMRYKEYLQYNIIEAIFQGLSEKDRVLYEMKFVQNKPLSEIAEYYNVNIFAANSKIQRLKNKVKRIIRDFGKSHNI